MTLGVSLGVTPSLSPNDTGWRHRGVPGEAVGVSGRAAECVLEGEVLSKAVEKGAE